MMVANTPRSRKTKGQEFQKEIVKILRKRFLYDTGVDDCFKGDIQAVTMGNSGVDIKLSPDAQAFIPFDIEAKRVERLDLWKAIKQAEDNTDSGRIPLICFKRNRSKIYAILELDDLLYVMD